MNLAFALDYIPRRMREMGFGDRYVTRYRHLRLNDAESIIIKAHNQLLLFIEVSAASGLYVIRGDPSDGIKIESERGVFDINDTTINEQQHEHSGEVKVSNSSGALTYVLFIQAIPQHKKKKP
jgi:hypothetical protein